jgi:hypothetical protein
MHESENHRNCLSTTAIGTINQPRLNILIAVAILLCPASIRCRRRGTFLTASLSVRTREVIGQLGLLLSLYANGWHYHDGDLPHGEELNLDDRSWQATDRLTKGSNGVIWLRRWFEMPKDLHGYDLAGNTHLAAVSSRRALSAPGKFRRCGLTTLRLNWHKLRGYSRI